MASCEKSYRVGKTTSEAICSTASKRVNCPEHDENISERCDTRGGRRRLMSNRRIDSVPTQASKAQFLLWTGWSTDIVQCVLAYEIAAYNLTLPALKE